MRAILFFIATLGSIKLWAGVSDIEAAMAARIAIGQTCSDKLAQKSVKDYEKAINDYLPRFQKLSEFRRKLQTEPLTNKEKSDAFAIYSILKMRFDPGLYDGVPRNIMRKLYEIQRRLEIFRRKLDRNEPETMQLPFGDDLDLEQIE